MADSASRRHFLKLAGAAALALGGKAAADPQQAQGTGGTSSPDRVPLRPLGRTGVQVSALCLGGYHLGSASSQKECARIISEAYDAGVTFIDNAWEYHDGKSERWVGEALRGKRDKFFLMTKVCTHGRDEQTAMKQLEESLRRLQTDYLDLWQVHEVIYENDPGLHNRAEGTVAALEKAKRQGKVRFVGFTGHKDPTIHLQMLSYGFPYDTCQLPLNCFDANFRSFQQFVLPELLRRGIAALGMKSMGGGGEPIKAGVLAPHEALRYAMSLPVATTVSGIESLDILRQNLKVARGFTPMSAEEMNALRIRVAPYSGDGRFELYKTSKKYDGEPGRKMHGFPSQEELGG